MEDIKIALTYDPEHLRKIYYRDGKDNVFKYKPTRKAIVYFLSAFLFTLIIYFASFEWAGISWLIILGLALMVFTGRYAVIVITRYQNWKNKVEVYLKELSQYKTCNIHLTSAAVEVTHDSTSFIEKWESIKSVEIFESHLTLYKAANEAVFLVPAKSVKPEEFIMLQAFIKNKIMDATEA